MKTLLFTLILMSGLALSAQKSIGEIKDTDELTLNVKN